MSYIDQLKSSAENAGNIVCMGLDPVLSVLPESSAPVRERISGYFSEIFRRMRLEGVVPAAFKPNIGYYASLDSPRDEDFSGSLALADTFDLLETFFPGVPVILDSKRGDIAKSSENYAEEAFGKWRADAVTVSPYMGSDSVLPFAREGKGVYILNRTSNPGAADIQNMLTLDAVDEKELYPFYISVAHRIAHWASDHPGIGAVVGATSMKELGEIAEYYADFGIEYDPDEIIVTTGASEAVLFSFITCFDPGDELITTEPTYANYLSFAAAAGVKVVPITTSIDDGFALPPAERFEELITERTRGILICNPNNPSGSLYSREEMKMLGDIVRRHGLFLFADEVYREFVYDGMEFFSAGHLEGVDDNVVIFDSMSKRFSECGIRTGAVITRNRAVTEGFLKLAQARLSPPLVGQIIAEASFSAGHAYLDPIAKEYQHRRDVLIEGLQNIPGIRVARPQGAFYVIASLPVENAEDFCAWCLSDFSDNGETVMMAPASGFYITPGLGPSEVRIAYVLNSDDLRRATDIIGKALDQYNSR